MCQGVQLILHAPKVIIGSLIECILVDKAFGMLVGGCFLCDALMVTFLNLVAIKCFKMLLMVHRIESCWQFIVPLGL